MSIIVSAKPKVIRPQFQPHFIRLPLLTEDEIFLCYTHGAWRRMKKYGGERKDREQLERSPLDNDANGACAEWALNKYYDSFPKCFSDIREPDCPAGEVRWTGRDDGRLIIYRSNPEDRRYILTTGFAPQLWVVGWKWGRDGKRDDWYDNDARYYYVPRSQLHPGLPTLAELWEEKVMADKTLAFR